MDKRYKTVIEKNSFFFSNPIFEEKYEAHTIQVLKTLIHNLKNNIVNDGSREEVFVEFIMKNEFGLEALLVLNGLAKENLKRIITLARVVRDKELSKLLYLNEWEKSESNEDIKEWSDEKIKKTIRENSLFAMGIINLFFYGSSNLFLANTLPLFELNKLSVAKINFDLSAMYDTLIRYRQKGSYTAESENNPEKVIEKILLALDLNYEKGDLPILAEKEPNRKRTMDFIIPDKINPVLVIESSYLSTTSSGMGDKAKTEISISELIKKYYKQTKFFGFVDGIGWYVRKKDMTRICSAFDDVFTFHRDEILRFEIELKNLFGLK